LDKKGQEQGNRILSSQDLEQIIGVPATFQALGLDPGFDGVFLLE
jgi:hypothetical protein